jgi:hypothetical protein
MTPTVGLTKALQRGKHLIEGEGPLDVEEDLRNNFYLKSYLK